MSHEAELQKVKDLLDMGFIHDEEYERRIKEILGNDPIPPAFRVGGSSNTVDPFEADRLAQEEQALREEEERLRREEEMLIREEMMRAKRLEEERRFQQEEEMMLRREAEERYRREEEMRSRDADEMQRRLVEERALLEAEAMRRAKEEAMRQALEERTRALNAPRSPSTNTNTNTASSTSAPMSAEERRKAIEERQLRDKERMEAEVAEERNRQNERTSRQPEPYYYQNDTISYTPQETSKFDPNQTYSEPEYYAPTGIKLYPIYQPGYFSTVHPFAFIAANRRDPNDQEAIRNKTEEIKRIIATAQKATNWEEQQREARYQREAEEEKQRREAMQKNYRRNTEEAVPCQNRRRH
eukprot:TRINITY_DN2026_c0_g2_i2.p2 TRINITY_DN2026_c0_g2~~TRINITY_DN2026_c0_g2_i2.p2  ORF type:complete len:356 (+),score=93.62 TRINITY_DN2026_c0_g2_i2:34-1101(+)